MAAYQIAHDVVWRRHGGTSRLLQRCRPDRLASITRPLAGAKRPASPMWQQEPQPQWQHQQQKQQWQPQHSRSLSHNSSGSRNSNRIGSRNSNRSGSRNSNRSGSRNSNRSGSNPSPRWWPPLRARPALLPPPASSALCVTVAHALSTRTAASLPHSVILHMLSCCTPLC
jgi:hypothetical protein